AETAAEPCNVEAAEDRRLGQQPTPVADAGVALLDDRHALRTSRVHKGRAVPASGLRRVVAQHELEEPTPRPAGRGLDRPDGGAARELGAQDVEVPLPAAVQLLEPRQAAERQEGGV